MMHKFFVFSTIALLVACNDTGNNTGNNNAAATDTPAVTLPQPAPEPVKACYLGVLKKDTVELRISKAATVVTGSLRYKNFEKDSSKGSLAGVMRGDTLVAQYTFQAEGTTSTRQVAFVLKDSTAKEGYGDVEEKDGKMVFKDLSRLDFSKSKVLKQMPCSDSAE